MIYQLADVLIESSKFGREKNVIGECGPEQWEQILARLVPLFPVISDRGKGNFRTNKEDIWINF
jgi:hypothetical protein